MQELPSISCQKCGFEVLKSYEDGKRKLRGRIIIFQEDGKSHALCKACGTAVDVPIQIITLKSAAVESTAIAGLIIYQETGKNSVLRRHVVSERQLRPTLEGRRGGRDAKGDAPLDT